MNLCSSGENTDNSLEQYLRDGYERIGKIFPFQVPDKERCSRLETMTRY